MDWIARLIEEYKNYITDIKSSDDGEAFVIINPFLGENIYIDLEEGELTFHFSYHHAHFGEDIKSLIDYIDDFLRNKLVVFEFYEGDFCFWSGARGQEDIDLSSGESALRSVTKDELSLWEHYYNLLKGVDCRCSIRSWDSLLNKDMDFTL